MRKDNPAVYECPRSGGAKLHRWQRQRNRTAICLSCKLVLNVDDADEVFEDRG